MADFGPFPDTEAAVIELLTELLDSHEIAYSDGFTFGSLFDPGTSCDVVTPANLERYCPFIKVVRIGGNDDRFTDAAKVDVETFALRRSDSKFLAEQVRQTMISYPHVLSDCVIDLVSTDVSASEIPWGNPSISHFVSSFQVSARRPA